MEKFSEAQEKDQQAPQPQKQEDKKEDGSNNQETDVSEKEIVDGDDSRKQAEGVEQEKAEGRILDMSSFHLKPKRCAQQSP